MPNSVPVRKHTRRRAGRTGEIARRLGLEESVTIGGYRRGRQAVPRWTQTSSVPGKEQYKGRYKNFRLYVHRTDDGYWYWSMNGPGIEDFGVSRDAGTASRQAEAAAGYEYAQEVLDYGMAFQDPTERTR